MACECLAMPNPVSLSVRASLAVAGLRQKDIAELLGISQSGVSARMNGSVEFRPSELKVIADRLDVPVTHFFTDAAA